MTTGLAPRRAALAWREQVLTARRPLDTVLAEAPETATLSARDLAFARAILMAVLRHGRRIDTVLSRFLARPLPFRAGRTRALLELAAAEILVLGAAPHAAVDCANAMAAADREARHFKPLVNAVLRRVAAEGPALFAATDPAHALPDWLMARWQAAYGADTARKMAAAVLTEPPLDITLKDPGSAAHWAAALEAAILPTGTLRRPGGGRIEDLPGFAEGAWWVQDAAAALPARLLGPVRGMDVLDLCAAPGGKTAQLAAAGATVTAVDASETRLARVRETLGRLGLTARLVCADLRTWAPETLADAVLLDAPCSATGTLRRHPDIAWLKSAADIVSAHSLQADLLAAAAQRLRPGGRLVYAVCSLEPEEGEDLIAASDLGALGLVPDPVQPAEVPGLHEALTPQGHVRTRPDMWVAQGHLDGFFIARFRKV